MMKFVTEMVENVTRKERMNVTSLFYFLISLPHDKILNMSKVKAFSDDKINTT